MDNYEVIRPLGEGSFGRVYKAKQISDSRFVALKVISKRGRSAKELKGLRRECEIQRHLHHPNIIQMLNSFETDNEIVVITELAHKELYVILGKEGYLHEDRVQPIVWDLLSALYYLHSHRVLHRDLKPQNILMDARNCAKLCDFGFARNMSTGTHVLTSIKGTPMYMAPELIEEQPYDHNADLWSLGCIIYELLVGAPPFSTSSILHLIRLIRHQQIQWPTFLTENCISFLKGLLQKKPTKRMSWPEILAHPFVNGHVLIISNNTPSMPLTRPMSANTLQVKEQQRKDHIVQKHQKPSSAKTSAEPAKGSASKNTKDSTKSATTENKKSQQDVKNNNDNVEKQSFDGCIKKETVRSKEDTVETKSGASGSRKLKSDAEASLEQLKSMESDRKISISQAIQLPKNTSPIENEEWVVFLQKTIEEVMGGELTSLSQPNLASVVVSPLRHYNCSPKVVALAASLLSYPFTAQGIPEKCLETIKNTYIDVKVIPNLVNVSKLLMKQRDVLESTGSSSSDSPVFTPQVNCYKSVADLNDVDLKALEYTYLLICHLVHLNNNFLTHFCDAVVILNTCGVIQRCLLLSKVKLKLVMDLIAILTQILRKLPENSDVVSQIIQNSRDETNEAVAYVDFLRHSNPLLRERMCCFLQLLGRNAPQTLETIWNLRMRETLEALVYDSVESVRNAADAAVENLKVLQFY